MLQRLLAVGVCALVALAAFGGSIAILQPWRQRHEPEMLLVQPSLQQGVAPRFQFTAFTAEPAPTTSAESLAIKAPNAAREPAEGAAAQLPIRTMYDLEVLEIPPPSPPSTRSNWGSVEYRLEQFRHDRQGWARPHYDLANFYSQLADPRFTSSKDYEQHLLELARWREEFPESPAALVAAADAYIHYAWQARGGGGADKVTARGWGLFATRIQEAHRLLDQALRLSVKDGAAYRSLINIAYAEGQPKQQAFAWLEAGQKVDPTYYPMYEQMTIYLLPRWSGDPGDVETFANEMAKRLPGDDGLEAMARIALMEHNYGEQAYYGETLLYGEYDRELLVQAAETLAKRYPDTDRFVHFAALCALAAQDHQAAKRIRPHLTRYNKDHRIWLWEPSYNHFWKWSGTAEDAATEETWAWATAGGGGWSQIAFGSDSRHIWCAQQVGRSAVNLMDMRTGDVEAALPHPGGEVNALAVDHERGWVVIAASRGPLMGWVLHDLSVGDAPIKQPTAEKCDVVAIHPKSPQVFWTESKTLRSRDVKANKAGPTIELPTAARRIQFSPDGSVLAVDVGRILVYDAATGALKAELPHAAMQPQPAIDCKRLLAVDDDGRVLAHAASIGQQPVKAPVVQFSADGTSWETLIPNTRSSVSYLSRDRRLLAVARLPNVGPSGIEVWELASGQRIKQFDGHWNRIGSIAFSPDNQKLASVGVSADVIKVWSLTDVVSK